MNFITQLLPGLRDVRGPLIAGYLWLFAGWVFIGAPIPHEDTAVEPYRAVIELGNALGQVGLVVVLSIAAYLIGSLLQAVVDFVGFAYKGLREQATLRIRRLSLATFAKAFVGPEPAETVLATPPVFSPKDFRGVDGDRRARQTLDKLVRNRLSACTKDLEVAVEAADARVRSGAPAASGDEARIDIKAFWNQQDGWGVAEWAAVVGDGRAVARPELTEFVGIPGFSAARDIFDERSTIKTRLMETAEHAGSEVERLYAESDFRFTIAFPLAAVAVALACESGDLRWLALFGAVLGLLTHSVVLRKQGGREMVEALRSRPNDKMRDQITPAFNGYEEAARKFVQALEAQQWEALGASAGVEGDG